MAVDTPARIAVLGAGPVGLEVALYGRFLGYEVDIYEQGQVAENVLRWGHVTMFSPFAMNRSPLGLAALVAQDPGYISPKEDALLTGQEWARSYLLPLSQSDLLATSIHSDTTVLGIGRSDMLKSDFDTDQTRANVPFRLLVENNSTGQRIEQADIVIDSTGCYGNPNWLGRGGIPALGELEAKSRIRYDLPDPLQADRSTYCDSHTLVVGSGYSAATTVLALSTLANEHPNTRVTWLTRGPSGDSSPGPMIRIPNDRLNCRDRLAEQVNQLANEDSPIEHLGSSSVDAVGKNANGRLVVTVSGKEMSGQETTLLEVDQIVANVGFRPNLDFCRELQISQSYVTEGSAELDGNLLADGGTDCLDRSVGLGDLLITTEPNFYVLGSKSYGRKSPFLFSAGLEQIRHLFTIIGDRDSLDLYASSQSLNS